MIYSMQPNWFHDHIRPKAIRRAVIAFGVAAALIVSGLVLDSVPVLVISAVALLFGILDVVGLKNAKLTVETLKVCVLDEGLVFIIGPGETRIVYPWRTLSITKIQQDELAVKSFVIRDTSRRRSYVQVSGYENISDLFATVQKRAGNG